jgi:hypothetical protein
MAANNLKDLFGSDSDDSGNEEADPGSKYKSFVSLTCYFLKSFLFIFAVAVQKKSYNLDQLFGSSDDDSDAEVEDQMSYCLTVPLNLNLTSIWSFWCCTLFSYCVFLEKPTKSSPKKASRLKKATSSTSSETKKSKPQKARQNSKPQESEARVPKKRPRPTEDAAADRTDAYDSGEEAAPTAADNDFIDSDDDLGELKKEYDAEGQNFEDEERDGEFVKKPGSSKRSESEVVKKGSSNMIDQAILSGRRKKTKDMVEQVRMRLSVCKASVRLPENSCTLNFYT